MSKKWDRLLTAATVSMQKGDFSVAVQTLTKALAKATATGDALEQFETLTALGCAQANAGNKLAAEEVYIKALAFSALSGEFGEYPIGLCMTSLANVYFELGRFNQSRIMALEAFNILDSESCEDRSAVLLPVDLLLRLSVQLKAYEQTACLIDGAVTVLRDYPGQHGVAAIRPLQKFIRLIPPAVRKQHEQNWAILEDSQKLSCRV